MMIFNKEIIIILSIFSIFFSIIVLWYSDEIPEDIYSMMHVSPIIITTILSFSLSRRYKKCGFFSYGHLVLGMALSSLLLGEVAWRLMAYLNMAQYESYPDIFYYMYNILLVIHPFIIMKFFKVKPSKVAWLLFALCMVVGNSSYIIISDGFTDTDSFAFGLIFVTLTNAVIGSTVMAILTLRGTKIFRIWIFIGVALTINAIADIYYYASENFSDWGQGDLVNIVWFVGYVILLYALVEHIPVYTRKNKL